MQRKHRGPKARLGCGCSCRVPRPGTVAAGCFAVYLRMTVLNKLQLLVLCRAWQQWPSWGRGAGSLNDATAAVAATTETSPCQSQMQTPCSLCTRRWVMHARQGVRFLAYLAGWFGVWGLAVKG